jgi:4-hydroxyproline epimerase
MRILYAESNRIKWLCLHGAHAGSVVSPSTSTEPEPKKMRERLERVRVVDSHTGGEPTRIIVAGGPELPSGTITSRLEEFRRQHDYLRHALVNEPRGSEVVVGALLCEPENSGSTAGVIFFNNVGYLGMCVHGTIGLIVTLSFLGKIGLGEHKIDTPVGTVTATLHERGEVTVANVPSRRTAARVAVHVPGYGTVRGDIAWAGNWFFLIGEHSFELAIRNIEELTQFTWAVRQALEKNGIRGADGREIDHIELFSPSAVPGVDSKNFVLCPGKAYDRSPCGTGTSAKLACLYAEGKLAPGGVWRQESIVGSVFEGQIKIEDGQVIPIVKGSAFITSEADLIFDPCDPFRYGIPHDNGC